MDQDMAPPRRRRLTAQGMMLRRTRIFARLREGLSYDEIAAEERLSTARIRQIVSEVLQKRAIDNSANHAKLQLDRLACAMQLAAEGIAAGMISAINPYLKVLDRLDRYQTVVGAHEGFDQDARQKLLDKLTRMAANLGLRDGTRAKAGEPANTAGAIAGDGASEAERPETPETQASQAEDAKKWFESSISP